MVKAFLMHRVELKAFLGSDRVRSVIINEFLMHRVELKVTPPPPTL